MFSFATLRNIGPIHRRVVQFTPVSLPWRLAFHLKSYACAKSRIAKNHKLQLKIYETATDLQSVASSDQLLLLAACKTWSKRRRLHDSGRDGSISPDSTGWQLGCDVTDNPQVKGTRRIGY